MNTVKKHAGHGIKQVQILNYLLNNLQQFNLKPTTKLVLLYLAGCYNPKHVDVFPKQKTIALQMGISEASVIRAIQELHKEGLIISERKYTNRYKFTAKILNLGAVVEDLPNDNKMQVETSQKATSETSNLQAPYKEQVKEQITQQEDDELLIKFAESKGAKNKVAYINAIKRNGGATEIVNEMRQVEANAKAMQTITKTFLEADKESRKTAEEPTKEWKELKAKLQQLCK